MTKHNTITFFVAGTPVCKQSFRYTKNGGYTPAHVKAWQEMVGWEATAAMVERDMLAGDLEAELTFYLPDKHRRDLDNLSKAVLDAMNNLVYKDDSQIMKLTVEKRYEKRGEYGVFITISEKGE